MGVHDIIKFNNNEYFQNAISYIMLASAVGRGRGKMEAGGLL